MLCATNSSSPPSPAGSEISVGAPSPPPPKSHQQQQQQPENDRRRNGDDYFRPLKRLKGISNAHERSVSPPPAPVPVPLPVPAPPAQQRSSLDGVKSFSIADILGHETNSNNNNINSNNNNSTTASNQHQTAVSTSNNSHASEKNTQPKVCKKVNNWNKSTKSDQIAFKYLERIKFALILFRSKCFSPSLFSFHSN